MRKRYGTFRLFQEDGVGVSAESYGPGCQKNIQMKSSIMFVAGEMVHMLGLSMMKLFLILQPTNLKTATKKLS